MNSFTSGIKVALAGTCAFSSAQLSCARWSLDLCEVKIGNFEGWWIGYNPNVTNSGLWKIIEQKDRHSIQEKHCYIMTPKALPQLL